MTNKNAIKLGRLGGLKRAINLSPEQRSTAARHAANMKWAKIKKDKSKK